LLLTHCPCSQLIKGFGVVAAAGKGGYGGAVYSQVCYLAVRASCSTPCSAQISRQGGGLNIDRVTLEGDKAAASGKCGCACSWDGMKYPRNFATNPNGGAG